MNTKRQLNRLLNVAKALRDYQHPERFDMDFFVYDFQGAFDKVRNVKKAKEWCGTPGCALGTYASRGDLQRVFKVKLEKTVEYVIDPNPKNEEKLPVSTYEPSMVLSSTREPVSLNDKKLHEHFGISYEEALELFDYDGCDCAETPLEAAEYIEQFVARKMLEEQPALLGKIIREAMSK